MKYNVLPKVRDLMIGFALVLMPIVAVAEKVCPEFIETEQNIKNAPEGWQVGNEKLPRFPLADAKFFVGSPELMKTDIPAKTGNDFSIWTFLAGDAQKYGGIWLTCGYGYTTVMLLKRLPDATRECKVTYNPRVAISGSKEIVRIECK